MNPALITAVHVRNYSAALPILVLSFGLLVLGCTNHYRVTTGPSIDAILQASDEPVLIGRYEQRDVAFTLKDRNELRLVAEHESWIGTYKEYRRLKELDWSQVDLVSLTHDGKTYLICPPVFRRFALGKSPRLVALRRSTEKNETIQPEDKELVKLIDEQGDRLWWGTVQSLGDYFELEGKPVQFVEVEKLDEKRFSLAYGGLALAAVFGILGAVAAATNDEKVLIPGGGPLWSYFDKREKGGGSLSSIVGGFFAILGLSMATVVVTGVQASALVRLAIGVVEKPVHREIKAPTYHSISVTPADAGGAVMYTLSF